MLFFITGASGSGKSACLPYLGAMCPDLIIYDFDEVGVSEHADTSWRQTTTEVWLQKSLEHQKKSQDVVICGGAIPGEIHACPSAPEINTLHVCLLDCEDHVRINRIHNGGAHGDAQEMLNWAAWQRRHALDPQWRPDVIRRGGAPGMDWDRWAFWQRGDDRWNTWMLDTTDLSIEEVAARTTKWIRRHRENT